MGEFYKLFLRKSPTIFQYITTLSELIEFIESSNCDLEQAILDLPKSTQAIRTQNHTLIRVYSKSNFIFSVTF